MRLVLVGLMVLMVASLVSAAGQPVSFEGMSPLKDGHKFPWFTGSDTIIYNGITFKDFIYKEIWLIWQQQTSSEEQQWLPGNKSIGKALNGFVWTDTLYITSALSWGTTVPQGATVTTVTVVDQQGTRHTYPIQAGIHTAEWSQSASPAHNNNLPYILGPSTNPPWNCKEYFAAISLGMKMIPKYIYLDYVFPGSSGGAISITAITFNRVRSP